jgi:serine/threonine protein kinase
MQDDKQPHHATGPVELNTLPLQMKPYPIGLGVVLDRRYRIEKELGRGSIAIVYLAVDEKLPKVKVVVKVLREKWDDDKQQKYFERKFREEIEALKLISHPSVVRPLDVGELSDGRSYIVMEFIDGVTLRSQIGPQGMELARVANLFRQIGPALSATHKKGVLHRDLKPENIMLQVIDEEDYVKLIDFGIATVVDQLIPTVIKTTRVTGTVPYMAPEQLRGKPGAASDIYALGVIAYEMVTGQLPFNPDSPYQLLELQRAGVKIRPRDLRSDLPSAAEDAILKALSFDSKDRPASVREFVSGLIQALTDTSSGEIELQGQHLVQVLFSDIVGFAPRTIEEQIRLGEKLKKVVQETHEFQRAKAANRLISIPTGDGIALVFFGGDPLTAVKCAVEISRALKTHLELKLRIGLHTGMVQVIKDINGKANVSGKGIITAQRIMDCGGTGHILLSRTVADDLTQLSEWLPHVHDCGERKVKHGVRVPIFNLCNDEIGNKNCPKTKRLPPLALITALLIIIALIVLALLYTFVWSKSNSPTLTDGPLHSNSNEAGSVAERELSYSVTVLKNPERYPSAKPERLSGTIQFESGDQLRLEVESPQAGFLYVINEGPNTVQDGLPDFNILFPSLNTSGGSAELKFNEPTQIPQPSGSPEMDWIRFDNQNGIEKIWLIWSSTTVPELETVKARASSKHQGVISDPGEIKSVQQYLIKHSTSELVAEQVGSSGQTTKLKGKGEVLVGLINLEHH